jgi:hypothetical protein
MRMRMFWVMSLSVFGLLFIAGLVSRPTANAVVPVGEIRQSSVMIDQLTANAKNLPVQSFDAF